MFWLAYLFTVIVGGPFAVILRVLRKVAPELGVGCELGRSQRQTVYSAMRQVFVFSFTPMTMK